MSTFIEDIPPYAVRLRSLIIRAEASVFRAEDRFLSDADVRMLLGRRYTHFALFPATDEEVAAYRCLVDEN